MAQKRMFDKSVIDSDAFLDMPHSSQSLYFHLNMRADDEGFIDNSRRIMRMIGSNDDDLRILITKNFIIPFESGVIVIKHWRVNNYLNQTRIKKTSHEKERALLTFNKHNEYLRLTSVKQLPKQYSIEESSIVENRVLEANASLSENSDVDFQTELERETKRLEKLKQKREQGKKIIEILNEELGKRYSLTDAHFRRISARLEEGKTIEDFERVIKVMKSHWFDDPHMKKFLRPETLFGTKFESYLNLDVKNENEGFKSHQVMADFDNMEEKHKLTEEELAEFLEKFGSAWGDSE